MIKVSIPKVKDWINGDSGVKDYGSITSNPKVMYLNPPCFGKSGIVAQSNLTNIFRFFVSEEEGQVILGGIVGSLFVPKTLCLSILPEIKETDRSNESRDPVSLCGLRCCVFLYRRKDSNRSLCIELHSPFFVCKYRLMTSKMVNN